jgi:hypothetical protein
MVRIYEKEIRNPKTTNGTPIPLIKNNNKILFKTKKIN